MKKCLILDLDDTLWEGTIGEDGIDGIKPRLKFQSYLKLLTNRGLILAVCSKNNEQTARSAFEHPAMFLAIPDFAAFIANWRDKSENIKDIAETLNLGLDAMVFVDDSPYERELIKARLPMVAVCEPEQEQIDVHFPNVAVTTEDTQRTQFYADNKKRDELRAAVSLPEYLSSLNMRLIWSHFDRAGLPRIHQLINKTNQFNLTTRRYTEDEIKAVKFGLQFRLIDRFGDNGMIAVVICRELDDDWALFIDTWLMSCRVLGRGVEQATLNVIAEQAKRTGYRNLLGEYRKTERNQIVSDLYPSLGFIRHGDCWLLPLNGFKSRETFIAVEQYRDKPPIISGDTFKQMTGVLRRVFCHPDLVVTAETSAADVAGWDSLSNIQLVVMIEKVFGIKFKTGELEELKNVGDFVRLIEAKKHALSVA